MYVLLSSESLFKSLSLYHNGNENAIPSKKINKLFFADAFAPQKTID